MTDNGAPKTLIRRRTMLAGLGAAAVALPACRSSDGSVPVSGNPVGSTNDGSVLPYLVPKAELKKAASSEQHASYAPACPPRADRSNPRLFEVLLEVLEGVCPLDPASDTSTLMWGFRIDGDNDVSCGTPGPVLRGRVGDVARITLTNRAGNQHPHNIDFHAVTGQGGGAEALTVGPGETATIEVRLLYPGAFMYHCAFGDVPEHIARGMYSMFIVDPEKPLPDVDHEWAVMQSEWYVGPPDGDGVAPFDRTALTNEEPRYVTFNGRTDALIDDNALKMRVGQRARIYMVNEGLNLDSNFHPIGSHWDTVYPEAATHPSNGTIRGSQSTLVVAGGGTITELVGLVPSTVLLVDHALVRTFYKGCLGHVVIEGDADPEIFEAGASNASSEQATEDTTAEQDGSTVVIPPGAFDPSKPSWDPEELTISVGTTVRWTNNDTVIHTVTSGESDGTRGTPDGAFDSGDLANGDEFSFTFDQAGEYPYYCRPHPWMIGTIIVEG